MQTNNPFYKLPAPAILTTVNGKDKFYEKINKLDDSSNDKYIKYIGLLIYKKIINNYWTVEDYRLFRKIFFRENDKSFYYMKSSIITCLKESNKEIYQQLESFSKDCSWYPITEKKKDENNQYINVSQKINMIDCYYIINNLVKYINQYINKYANNIILDLNNEDLKNDEIIEKINKDFIKKFEKEFQFITKYSLFEDIYNNMYQDSFKRLLENINYIITKNNEKQAKNRKWCATPNAQTHSNSITPFRKTLCRNRSN